MLAQLSAWADQQQRDARRGAACPDIISSTNWAHAVGVACGQVVYKRYASLYFVAGVEADDNELITLEVGPCCDFCCTPGPLLDVTNTTDDQTRIRLEKQQCDLAGLFGNEMKFGQAWP